MNSHRRPEKLLDPGLCLTLRPMQYPGFFDMYKSAIKNSWTVDEVDVASDVDDIRKKLGPRERHLIERHLHSHNSVRARQILAQWDSYLPKFVKIMPTDYRRALQELLPQAEPPPARQGRPKELANG